MENIASITNFILFFFFIRLGIEKVSDWQTIVQLFIDSLHSFFEGQLYAEH